MALKNQLQEDIKAAMRARESERLTTLRMLSAAIKQREVDERSELDDAAVLQITEKLIKQRREAAGQYAEAGRSELEAKELSEIEILSAYLPEPLSEAELDQLIDAAIAAAGATSLKQMGQVMNAIRGQAQGRADMGAVSKRVKNRLSGG